MDDRALLDRLARSIPEPSDVMEGLQRRRAAKLRHARIAVGALSIALIGAIAVLALSMLGSRDEGPITAPPDPYEAVWTSTDIADGSPQTLTIASREDGYRVVLVDEIASTFCGDQAGTMRGSASPPAVGEALVVEWRTLECDDGQRLEDPTPFEFRGDPASGTLLDQSDTTWTRTT